MDEETQCSSGGGGADERQSKGLFACCRPIRVEQDVVLGDGINSAFRCMLLAVPLLQSVGVDGFYISASLPRAKKSGPYPDGVTERLFTTPRTYIPASAACQAVWDSPRRHPGALSLYNSCLPRAQHCFFLPIIGFCRLPHGASILYAVTWGGGGGGSCGANMCRS